MKPMDQSTRLSKSKVGWMLRDPSTKGIGRIHRARRGQSKDTLDDRGTTAVLIEWVPQPPATLGNSAHSLKKSGIRFITHLVTYRYDNCKRCVVSEFSTREKEAYSPSRRPCMIDPVRRGNLRSVVVDYPNLNLNVQVFELPLVGLSENCLHQW